MPKGSLAVTVVVNAAPTVVLEGAAKASTLVAPAFTVMAEELPVILDETVSVALIVCDPAVFRFALKVPVPLVRVELAGKTACASLPLKCTVPA